MLSFVSVWLRRWLLETPVFIAQQRKQELSERLPKAEILKKPRKAVIPASLLSAALASTVILSVVVLPVIM